jgi:predicted regulator of Ras-like GTPase activity (Roadblock/LC7/MglB family)
MAERDPAPDERTRSDLPPARPTSRAREFREVVADLSRLAGVRGGLIVTAEGLVVTADLPPRLSAEPLAALAATLGRELERSMEDLDHGAFRTACFSAPDGSVLVGGSSIGFLVVVTDGAAALASVTPAIHKALTRLEGAWAAS